MKSLQAAALDLCSSSSPDLPLPQRKAFRQPKTILLAEDDDALRYVMDCTLTSMGYRVIACADAQVACCAFHSRSGIDILLTDVEMPGRSGFELARELTKACPSLPVMIITGSTLSDETLQEIEDKRWIYVRKPYRLPSLEATLEQLLEA